MIESNISSVALTELYKQNIDGSIPVLVDIYNPDMNWGDNVGTSGQENCHLRLINDTNMVKYKGKTYLPSSLTVQLPTTDGTKVGSASITLSAIDSSIVYLLRNIRATSSVNVISTFAKFDGTKYKFYELKNITFDGVTTSYNQTAATINLTFDTSLQRTFPVDTATKDRLSSVRD